MLLAAHRDNTEIASCTECAPESCLGGVWRVFPSWEIQWDYCFRHYLVPMGTLAPLTMLGNWRYCGWESGGRCSLLASVRWGHLGVCEPGTKGQKGWGTCWASLGVSHKLLLFLEDSHVQPGARSDADNICYPHSLEKWEAEFKPSFIQ